MKKRLGQTVSLRISSTERKQTCIFFKPQLFWGNCKQQNSILGAKYRLSILYLKFWRAQVFCFSYFFKIVEYLHIYEISCGWFPSLNRKFIYVSSAPQTPRPKAISYDILYYLFSLPFGCHLLPEVKHGIFHLWHRVSHQLWSTVFFFSAARTFKLYKYEIISEREKFSQGNEIER